MATRKKSGQRPPKSLGRTIEKSTNSSVIEEKLFERVEEEDDGPLVFVCEKCKLIVGDSMSWDNEDNQKHIGLKRVTKNVLIGEESRMYEPEKKAFCLITDLICQGCDSVIGMVYTSTPKKLDHKRFMFYLNVADIDSYVLGSAKQMLPAEGPEELPVTLEYRSIVEQQLTEVKIMAVSLAQTLEDIESGL